MPKYKKTAMRKEEARRAALNKGKRLQFKRRENQRKRARGEIK